MELAQETTIEQRTIEVNAQINRLARQLCNFANVNPAFKNGKQDYICIEVTSSDRVDPELPVDFGDDDDDDSDESDSYIPEATFTYKFEAERQRYIVEEDDKRIPKAHVMFIFSVMGINKNVSMPEDIAEDVIGLPGKEAVREIGPVTLQATTMFKLSTGMGQFSVCDHAEYIDLDGDPMHEAPCSCENNYVAYVPEYEVDDDGDTINIDDIRQLPSTDLYHKSQNEVVEYSDIEKATEEWASMVRVGEMLDLDVTEERLVRARHVLANIQAAIWTQAGFTPDQQRSLRLRLERSA